MKKSLLAFLVFSAMMVLSVFVGCKYDTINFDQPGEVISFSNDIIPIFDASCNTSGCHSQGGIPPDLTAVNAYNSLIDGGFVNINEPDQSELYLWVNGQGSIPMPLSGTEPLIASRILAWIEQGAENN